MTGRWCVADCMMTWHADWTLTCLMTGRWHACWLCILASWWRHPFPGLAHRSGRLVFGSGQLIRVEKTRVTRGARLCAWAVSSPARDGACGGFRRLISTRFSTVASSLPPLHSGMVKTQFWQISFLSKIKHPFKPCALIPIVGNSDSPCADRGCSDICSTEGKAHWHNILCGSAKPPTSTGESPYYLEIEKGYNKYMEKDHSTPSSHTMLHMAAGLLPCLSLLLFTFSHTLIVSHSLSQNMPLL